MEITGQVQDFLNNTKVSGDFKADGALVVFTPHTTAGVTINENADPSVVLDMAHALDLMVPWSHPAYAHSEGNSAAHMKSTLVGCSEMVFFGDGRLELGKWQGIFLCEFDGPRTRHVRVRIIG